MNKVHITAILIVTLVVILNLVANEFHLRLDLTENKQYTLSQSTKDIIKKLEDPITIKAYFSKDLPPQLVKLRKDFQETLIEYVNMGDGLIQYEFINPNEKEAYEKEALQKGIQPRLINVREKDQVKQQKVFLAAMIYTGDKQEIIYPEPEKSPEYELSMAIKKLSVSQKPTIGFMQGHGEASLAEMPQLNQQLQILYTTKEVPVTDSTDIPADIKTLVIVRPTDTLNSKVLGKLNSFLGRGGRLAIAMNRVNANMQNGMGMEMTTGLEGWLKNKGVEVSPDFVIDVNAGSVTMQQPGFQFPVQVRFHYLPVVGRFADHPVSKGLETVLLEFVSSVKFTGDNSVKFTPLIFTSQQSNTLPAPQFFDINKQWTEADFPMSSIVMGAALEGTFSGKEKTKIVVFGDGDFIVNGMPQDPRQQQAQPKQPDNISLVANAIDWLSDDTGLVELRTKGVTSRPIKALEDSTRTFLKYLNFLLPIILVVAYGVIRFQQNRMRRLKRASLDYEKV